MRKALFLTLLLAFASALCWPTLANADPIVLVQSPVSVNQGSTFQVDINISGAADLYAYNLDLNFDPTILQAIDVTEGGFLLGGGSGYTTFFGAGFIDNTAGGVFFNFDTLLGNISGANGLGTLLQFDFAAISAGTSPLSLMNVGLVDSTSSPICGDSTTPACSSADGSVVINPVISTPEPSVFVLLAAAALFFLIHRRAWRIV